MCGQVGSILNFSLMYLLAPTVGRGSASGGLLAKLFSESTLKSWGAPGQPQSCPRSLFSDQSRSLWPLCSHVGIMRRRAHV